MLSYVPAQEGQDRRAKKLKKIELARKTARDRRERNGVSLADD